MSSPRWVLVTLFRDLFRPSPPTAGLFSTEVTLLTRVQELQPLMRGFYSGPHHFFLNTSHKRQSDNEFGSARHNLILGSLIVYTPQDSGLSH